MSTLSRFGCLPWQVSVATVSQDRRLQLWDIRSPDARWTKVRALTGTLRSAHVQCCTVTDVQYSTAQCCTVTEVQ